MRQVVSGRVISCGHVWRQRILFSVDVLPVDATYLAHVRHRRESNVILATLTTANGGLARIDARTIDLVIPAAATSAMPVGDTVTFDIVRNDGPDPEHLGFWVTVPVVQPVTRTI